MDSEDLEKVKTIEWNRLVRKISKDCKVCEGLGFVLSGGKASACGICIPKARYVTYLKDSGMNLEDIHQSIIPPPDVLSKRILFIQGDQKERQKLAFGILKEEAKNQKKVFFIELPNLLQEIKKGNKDYLRYDTLFIDSIDLYRTTDQFILPFFDGILFTFKNNKNKKLIVAGSTNSDGYASRFLETYGSYCEMEFV